MKVNSLLYSSELRFQSLKVCTLKFRHRKELRNDLRGKCSFPWQWLYNYSFVGSLNSVRIQ